MTIFQDTRKDNIREFIYVKGDADTDGSIRLMPDAVDAVNVEFQLRSNGVWNDTGIQIAASTVYLGRELEVSSGAEYIRTTVASEPGFQSLAPHIPYTEESGTSPYPDTPILSPITIREVFQPDDSREVSGTTIAYAGPAPRRELTTAAYYKTGSIAATEPVTLEFRRDSESGILFFRIEYPSSTFPAESEIRLDLKQRSEDRVEGETVERGGRRRRKDKRVKNTGSEHS